MSTTSSLSGADGVGFGQMQVQNRGLLSPALGRPSALLSRQSGFARWDTEDRVPPGNISAAQSHRPHSHHKLNDDGSSSLGSHISPPHHTTLSPNTTASPSLANGTVTPVTVSPTTRKGWLSNISSKFASHAHSTDASPSSPTTDTTQKHQPGFLIATLRKLSASSVPGRGSLVKNVNNNCKVERVVMNKNLTRDRCQIMELEGVKLKKVAFCVDVEVSIPPPPKNDGDVPDKRKISQENHSPYEPKHDGATVVDDSNQPSCEKTIDSKADSGERPKCTDTNDAKLAAEEGKALGEHITGSKTPSADAMNSVSSSPASIASNQDSINVESPEQHTVPKPEPAEHRPRRRPTTDVARIYKRCCQLRETPMLPIITRQLATYSGKTSIDSLDLSNNTLQLSDALVLSDFLALAPVARLDLENCGLSDESLRVILSGLLAVKQPTIRGRSLPRQSNSKENLKRAGSSQSAESRKASTSRARGMIEWLSLRNNPMISRDGWRYVSLFLHMSRSLKALDVSMIQLPRPPSVYSPSRPRAPLFAPDSTGLFCKALSERLAGVGLQELAMNCCDIDTEQLRCIVEAVKKGGTKRLDLEGNHITDDGLIYLAQWIKEGNCEGLSLSSNDLQEHIDILAASLHEGSPLQALRLANCNLNAGSLSTLLPALTVLKNFRLLDLSHNPLLFSTQPDALPLLRKYLPRLPLLKKLQLAHTFMTPDHAIGLSEILPEIKALAHFNVLDNPFLVPGAVKNDGSDSPDGANRKGSLEEGAALYTALAAAVQVSKTIVRMDIDDPGVDSGEVIRGLARKVVAFCLRNMEAAELYNNGSLDNHASGAVPSEDSDDDDTYGADGEKDNQDDLVVGGTGVVKALGVCLGNKRHTNKPPLPPGNGEDATAEVAVEEGIKANEMSKALLYRARKIKERIQPALQKAARGEIDEIHYRKLLFLDDTLYRVINRFEEEYPECRLNTTTIPPTSSSSPGPGFLTITAPGDHTDCSAPQLPGSRLLLPDLDDYDHHDESRIKTPALSRQPSDISLHSRALDAEEGHMHKLATFVRKEIFKKQMPASSCDKSTNISITEASEDHNQGSDCEVHHIRKLKALVEGMEGEEIRQRVVERVGRCRL
ncbi:hypothetical protein BDZ91DRAFT_793706 [Kalaharituber pfeilii]|nr:hypothetical protein BDZ91DRAFT_793706 [Kalaharituber pfeilii]